MASANNDPNVSIALKTNKVYRKRIEEIAGKELDYVKMLENFLIAAYQRMEQVFDIIQENPRSFQGDNYLLRYLTEISAAIEKIHKLKIDSSDHVAQNNISQQAIEEYTALLQESMRDTLAEIDPDAAALFMENYSERMFKIKLTKPISQEQKYNEAKLLSAKIIIENENIEEIKEKDENDD